MNYLVLKASLVLNYSGKTVVISKDDSRYQEVLKCIREERLGDIPAVVEIERGFANSGLDLRDGVLYDGEEAFPTELNARVLEYKEAQLPYDSLLKFWENLKKNPSFNSRKMLFSFLSHNGHALTEDGCFVAYRGITSDFKDKHTGKWDNSPGAVCEINRELVDDNPTNTCSTGLHVACFGYAKDFGEKLVEVKVNPADVVCVPIDYNNTKMRVCRFEVLAECTDMRDEPLYGHPKPADDEQEEEEYREDGQCGECESDNDSSANYCSNCGSDDLHSN